MKKNLFISLISVLALVSYTLFAMETEKVQGDTEGHLSSRAASAAQIDSRVSEEETISWGRLPENVQGLVLKNLPFRCLIGPMSLVSSGTKRLVDTRLKEWHKPSSASFHRISTSSRTNQID